VKWLRDLLQRRWPAKHWVGDGESVDTAEDYIPIARELLALGGLNGIVDAVGCSEDDHGRELVLAAGTRRWATRLSETAWIDSAPLLACLNEVATALGLSGRYFEFREATWGQELGVFFASDMEALRRFEERLEIAGTLLLRIDTRIRGYLYAANTDLVLGGTHVARGTLVSGQRIAGVPCREVAFTCSLGEWKLSECTLDEPHVVGGVPLPIGAKLRRTGDSEWEPVTH
jgi:hypothetical protein